MARLFGTILSIALLAAAAGCTPFVALPGPQVSAPALADDAFVAADGARLPLRRWLPEERPRAVILALHGFNDYSNAFAMPGPWFAARGVAIYAYDQRGFGAAPGRGFWPGTAALTADLRAVAAAVRARHPGLPLYLLGDSMGGAVVMTAMAEDPPPRAEGIILVAPAVWSRATMPGYQRAALWLAAHTVPWLTLTGRGLKRQASDNIEMLRALGRDPLVIKETRVDAIWGLANLMDAAQEAADGITAPSLILYGGNDEIIPPGPVDEMVENLPAAAQGRQRLARYPGGWHMLLRDLQREVVWRDIQAWLEDPAAPLPSQTVTAETAGPAAMGAAAP